MNQIDIEEVPTANRKINYENASNICEKVDRANMDVPILYENHKIEDRSYISYRDLEEKVRQTEAKYEEVQKNRAELQMKYETVSMKYQEALRLRPGTLNKVAKMKALVEVLLKEEEDLYKKVDTLNEARSNLNAIANAYASLSCTVKDLREKYLQLKKN